MPPTEPPNVIKRAALLAFTILCAVSAGAQSILTVAGGGTVDGQLIANIPTTGPRGIAFDRAGNIYLVIRNAGQVLRIDAATGIVKTAAGNGASGYSGDGGLAINATLNQPSSIALDAVDNLYITDTINNRVRRVDAKTGIITTYAGGGTPPDQQIGDGGPATSAALGAPWGLAINRGFLYITEQYYNTNRVRRVDMGTLKIDTIAGSASPNLGGATGDNGPAKDALLNAPFGIVADAGGNLYVADRGNGRIRRIDTNGTITTYAGGGMPGNMADSIPATNADLGDGPTVMAFDPAGNLLVFASPGVRKIDRTTHTITTVVIGSGIIYGLAVDASNTIYFSEDGDGLVLRLPPNFDASSLRQYTFAGAGTYVGDGLLATAAILHSPQGVALDAGGNLYIADDTSNIVRRVSAADGTIATVAGMIGSAYSQAQEGFDATNAVIGFPVDLAIDSVGNLYIADPLNGRVWRVDSAGKISTYAGGGTPADGFGDSGPATAARINPFGISIDRAGNLYIADSDAFATIPHARIRRVDAATKMISTVAGSGMVGFAGDGSPATQAQLSSPVSAVVDNDGNLLIADFGNGALRRVDHVSGNITTIAGRKSEGDPLGDGGPASDARLEPLHMQINRATGELFVADRSSHRIRKIDTKGIITTVAGSDQFYYEGGFAGDNGPATDAKLNISDGDGSGIAISAAGDLYFSDPQNNRVRAVLACKSVAAPQLVAPASGATTASTSPKLSWSAVTGAFRYDVRLDSISPPVTTAASDVDGTSFTPANLQPNQKYFWQVVAKGDRFCPAMATAPSAINSFTTANVCGAGAFDLTSPANGAQNVPGLPVQFTWQPSAGAATYDVYLGPTNPPPLVVIGLTQPAYATQVVATAYWFVVAHAACDATETATSPIRQFSSSLTRACTGSMSVTLMAPASGAANVATTVDLTWSGGSDIDTYDVYFGTSSTPPLLTSGLPSSTLSVKPPTLAAGTTYFWRVVGRGTCVPSQGASSALQSFTTRSDCTVPGGTSIIFAPQTVSDGATYAIIWSPAVGLGADGGYLVERSTSSSFATVLDAQVTSSTAASFLASAPGTLYHRVRALPSCDPTKSGPPSDVKAVTITSAPPNIIFTVQPQAVVTALGDKLEDQHGSFTLENIGTSSLQVIVGRQELSGSPPFFSIADDAAFITLTPRTPRTFAIKYSGPRNDTAGSYQGVVFVAATGAGGLAVTPYAFVNLKVGGGAASKPQFIVDGTPSDYAAFPGFNGDDSTRPSRQVTIRNNGTAPMELAAEVAPEVWLTPANGWNTTAVAPGASRTIDLLTQRSRAPNGSPLPRYTYFTVRTKDGASARLLVQDNEQLAVTGGRATALDSTARSFIVPEVVSTTSGGGHRLVTRMRLTNLGGDAVQAELIATPMGADGFDPAAVARAIVVVPPNDVVTLTDPLVQLFRFQAPSLAQIEVRLPRERVGLVAVRSSVAVIGGSGGFDTPVVTRGEGATLGAPHAVYLLPSSTVSLTLAETSGNDAASARLVLFDDNGNAVGTMTQQMPRYGMKRFDKLTASRIEINVDSGGGSVIGLATIANAAGEAGATVRSLSLSATIQSAMLARAFWKTPNDVVQVNPTIVVPVLAPSGSSTAKTSVGFVAPPSLAATFAATFRPPTGSGVGVLRNVNVPAGTTKIYGDLLAELFGAAPATQGSVFVQPSAGGKVYALLSTGSSTGGASTPASIPLPTTLSEALTAAAASAQRPLSYDGLEQSTDSTRGDRWLLLLNEVGGASGSVDVRLYEAGNRSRPIAESTFTLGGYQQLTLDSIFSALGLDAADRRKDRVNVQVVVTAIGGSARIAASAIAVDQNGATRIFTLLPTVGSGTPNVTYAAPVITQQPAKGRRRAVGK
jgi:sugar lactone lactonase YvrE